MNNIIVLWMTWIYSIKILILKEEYESKREMRTLRHKEYIRRFAYMLVVRQLKKTTIIQMTRILTISLLLISLMLNSCKQRETNGIEISETLYVHQDYKTNKELRNLIQEALDKNEKAISKLTNFPCGGGAGCYDLGFILTQIIYQIGENEFNQMVLRLDNAEIYGLRSLIRAGLEYGDNDKDGEIDDKRIETEFPILNETLKK